MARKRHHGSRHSTHWTREMVIEAIHGWVRMYGEPPRQSDWNINKARRLMDSAFQRAAFWQGIITIFEAGDWPTWSTVKDLFGSLGAAIEEAGYQPRSPGQHTQRGVMPSPFLLPLGHAMTLVYKAAQDPDRLLPALHEVGVVARRLERQLEREQREAIRNGQTAAESVQSG